MRVLVVDDSLVFRSQIKAALEKESDLDVVGVASNGKVAIQKLQQLSVDLVTLDLEMPEMNGIETLHEMKKQGIKTRVIVFSSISKAGSKATLEALSAGADDFVTKPSGDDINIGNAADKIGEQLLPKVRQFADRAKSREEKKAKATAPPTPVEKKAPVPEKGPLSVEKKDYHKKDLSFFVPKIVVIGSSTGGPAALEKVFQGLKPPFRCPLVIVQHMPPVFTASLAQRLQEICGVPCAEAKNGAVMESGHVYIAPGDYHLRLHKNGNEVFFRLDQGPAINYVRPAVDPLFETAAKIYGPDCGAFVLTGMGGDGQGGAIAVKEANGGVMIQSEESCVVYGMPAAVEASGAYDRQGDLAAVHHVLKSYLSSVAVEATA